MGELKERWTLGDKRGNGRLNSGGYQRGSRDFGFFKRTPPRFLFLFFGGKKWMHLSIGKHAQPTLAVPRIGLHFEKSLCNPYSSSEKVS